MEEQIRMTEEERQQKDNEYWDRVERLEKTPSFATATNDGYLQQGMTLRQYYIGQALQGAMAHQFDNINSEDDARNMAQGIIICVDALIERIAMEIE